MPYLETDDGIELFYTDWGTGTPVVLIHGWPVTSAMWEQQATFLAEHGLRARSRTIGVDLAVQASRGMGTTTTPSLPISMR